ncbi:MAG TPA: type II secretion system protein GspK [Kiritimatiellia bacterium]|nr:type II secretion system protein GspK [Kiritimatiellia bacterium]
MRHRLRLLGMVVGILALVIACGFLLFAAFAQIPQRRRLLEMALYFGAGGGVVLLARWVFLIFPEWLGDRRSPSRRLRRAQDARRAPGRARPVLPKPSDAREGGVLVLLLVLTGLVAALLLQSHALARTRAAHERAATERHQLRQAAVDAVHTALQQLAYDPDLGVDTTNDVWAARQWAETPLGISTAVRVRDEQARFDLNNLGAEPTPGARVCEDIVMDLQTLCGEFSPASRTAALRDFIDADRAGSREAEFYRRLNPPQRSPDRVLYGWRELTHVDGWGEADLLRRDRALAGGGAFDATFVDLVTLIPVARTRPLPININSAPRATLLAVLGMEQDRMVDTVLTLRAIRPIRQLDVLSLTMGVEAYERVRPYLEVRSQFFRVEAWAEREGRRMTIEALVFRQDDGRVRVVQWIEPEPA